MMRIEPGQDMAGIAAVFRSIWGPCKWICQISLRSKQKVIYIAAVEKAEPVIISRG